MTDMALELYKFLKKEKCLEQFKSNSTAQGCNWKYLMIHRPGSLISKSFLFTCTPEGFDFWYNINQKWLRLMKDRK